LTRCKIVEKCMSSMQTGTQMVKLRGGSKGLVRFFYLDQHKSCIRWRPSRKNEKAKISIDSIREVCEGKQSEIFQRYSEGSFDPNCCFSLYYGERLESLDLVSSTGEEARTWITGLKYLVAGISDEDSLQTFAEADKNGDGSLSISEVLQLLHKLNVNLPRQKVKQMFKEADTDDNQGTLDFEEFCSFYKMMSTRRDLYLLMLTYSNHKDHLDSIDLTRFLEVEQKMTKVTKDHCLEIVNKFEPCSENQKQGVLGIDGFTSYMRSPAGDIFNPEHYEVTQDMSQPLCNYFIASSHNTYLMGDQLMSQSRVDMYAWVLQAGCRCVEVDCWDGQDGEPIVHHGYTLTSKILFKDVIETINKYAFLKNDYPVILSIENHCSVPQQKKMAQYLVEVMGDKLDLSAVKADEQGHLPSPDTLKGKILVKGKKLPPNIDEDNEEGDVTDEDSADEMEDDCKLMNGDVRTPPLFLFLPPFIHLNPSISAVDLFYIENNTIYNTARNILYCTLKKKTMKLSRALSDLVKYTKSVGVSDIETQGDWQVSSLSETKAHQIMQQKAATFIHFNQRQLSRIYPSSYRVDSSNFNPQPFWNAGCHLVALNYQSEGRVLQLNRAKFNSNGNCGYILKPACMCEGVFNPMMEDPLPGQMKKQLVLKIISGQQLPKPKDSMLGDRGEIIDPFVEVEIIGLPVDCCKEQTRVVDDNGFNPMWEETLVFTLHMPELVLVRFLVWDHDPIGQDFIGQRTIAFNSMIPGFRHVYLEGMEEASIFVHVSVHDITGKWTPLCPNAAFRGRKLLGALKGKVASGIKGLFHRNPKQASLDSHVAAQLSRKHPFGAHLLRRTASEPTKGEPKVKKGFPEIAIDTKDYSSEGASEDRESEDRDLSASPQPPQLHQPDHSSTRHSPLPPATAITTTTPSPASNSEADSPVKGRGVSKIPPVLHRTTSAPVVPDPKDLNPSQSCRDPRVDNGTSSPMEHAPSRTEALYTPTDHTKDDAERKTETRAESPALLADHSVSSPQKVQVLRTMFGGNQSRTPVRRTKSEGYVRSSAAGGQQQESAVPEVCTDATLNDRLWSKLEPEPGNHRDSVSSSSSISSNDTVIDLSLPNLARKSLTCLNSGPSPSDNTFQDPPSWVTRPRSAITSFDTLRVSKSKSNPNLRQGHPGEPEDELQPRPLGAPREPPVDSPSRITQRRHTWSRLYMEGLKQSSSPAKKPSAAAVLTAAAASPLDTGASMSKSLGDLTSDDIACNFDSKYRSISRSFIVRPSRNDLRRGLQRPRPPSDLTEQLRRLTDVEPLTARDFATQAQQESPEEAQEEPPLRRMSSRSQSRVRYIANRAKEAQERKRLQGLNQPHLAAGVASISIFGGGSPIEERGNPEGACCVLSPPGPPPNRQSQTQSQTSPNSDNNEVFFMLKL
uniref:Phosphoinositide phospholipase C n=1 Tax=Oncorhynchus tshawytscha TaxID=74940 RepID=A0A8C8FP17_ONCTS